MPDGTRFPRCRPALTDDESCFGDQPPGSVRPLCDWALAIAKILLLACTRIWDRVSSEVSLAKSVSRITDSEEVGFSVVICNQLNSF